MRLRTGIRALVLDPDERIALVRFDYPDRSVWAAPGGGVEEGEDDAAALATDELHAEGVGDVRWWTLGELDASSDVRFAPRRLPTLLRELLRDGPGAEPLDVGV